MKGASVATAQTNSTAAPEVGATESFSYVFSALKGRQAGRDYFVAMCPLKLIPKIFLFDETEIPAELRAQRGLNRSRVPEIARYMIDNPNEYVFSSITASMDGDVRFKPVAGASMIGQLYVELAIRIPAALTTVLRPLARGL